MTSFHHSAAKVDFRCGSANFHSSIQGYCVPRAVSWMYSFVTLKRSSVLDDFIALFANRSEAVPFEPTPARPLASTTALAAPTRAPHTTAARA